MNMCFGKLIAIIHLIFSVVTAIGLYLAVPVLLALVPTELQISTRQIAYIYIGYSIYWMVFSLITFVGLVEKRRQLLDIRNKICPFMICLGISGFVTYLYYNPLRYFYFNSFDKIFRYLIIPSFLIIGIGLDILTTFNVSKVRKKMWIEPYSDQLRQHICESNQNLNTEQDLNEVSSKENRKCPQTMRQDAKFKQEYV